VLFVPEGDDPYRDEREATRVDEAQPARLAAIIREVLANRPQQGRFT
jgi:hypothetical protein